MPLGLEEANRVNNNVKQNNADKHRSAWFDDPEITTLNGMRPY